MLGGLSWQDVPDSELVARIGQAVSPAQRETAFDVIYQRYAQAVLAVCGGRLYDDPDAAQAAAQVALVTAYRDLTEGRPPRESDKLRSWLCGIAANRCREEIRRRGREAALPDEVADDEYEAASRRRRAEVDRILGIVAATFTESQQRIYELSTRQGLRGQVLANALGVAEKEANDDTWENKKRLWEGFGAYVLALEGRPYCPELAGILDRAAWNGQTFTRVLRLRIVRHLGTCATCGNCGTCRAAKRELVRPFAPALLPILAWPFLREQVRNAIRQVASTQPDRPTQPPTPPVAEPPDWQGRRRSGNRTRRLRIPALFGAAAIIPFTVALLITQAVVGSSGTPGPGIQMVAARMPAIAYSTGTQLVVRHGTAPSRTLAAIPAGTTVKRLTWSWNGHWLGWLTGPAQTNAAQAIADQVHITDMTTGVTHTWTCTGCAAGAFQGNQLLVDNIQGPPVTAYPVSGGTSSNIDIFPGRKGGLAITLLGSAPRDTGVVFFSGRDIPGSESLYRTTTAGKSELLTHLPDDAAPGGDRDFGGVGIVGASPDGTMLAYGGNGLGGDPGEKSDSITVLNLRTGAHSTIGLPADRAHPLRISTVWVTSSDQVYVSAWHQPGNMLRNGVVPDATVVPRVYRLQAGHWTNTGMITPRGAGGQIGWTAVITGEGRFTSYAPRTTGDLVAISGATRVPLATGVTAFAWAPATPNNTGNAVSAISKFRGSWSVHDGSLCVGQALVLPNSSGFPECSGSSNLGWTRWWMGCGSYPSASVPVCNGWAQLTFTKGPGDTVIATADKVFYTTDKNRIIASYRQPGSLEPGDTFKLQKIATGLLKTTYFHTHLSQFDLRNGNPYWCGPGISQANQIKCGA
jgi:DNA-directed RNA polymerase specialized sigma24 family protein